MRRTEIRWNWLESDMEFVKNVTPLDFQAKKIRPLFSPNFNSFSKKKHKKWVKMEKFTLLAKILHCRRQWRHWQIPPLAGIGVLKLLSKKSELHIDSCFLLTSLLLQNMKTNYVCLIWLGILRTSRTFWNWYGPFVCFVFWTPFSISLCCCVFHMMHHFKFLRYVYLPPKLFEALGARA